MSTTNVGLTYTSRDFDATWITFAHEIGHNFAAENSDEANAENNDSAQQGGIMNYASSAADSDVTYDGVIQFNPARKDSVCANLAGMVSGSAT